MADDPECSFCRKHKSQVIQMIAGPIADPRVFICDECVQVCVRAIIAEHPDCRDRLDLSPLKKGYAFVRVSFARLSILIDSNGENGERRTVRRLYGASTAPPLSTALLRAALILKGAPRKRVETYVVGRTLISGQCKDIGRFKGPILRGLAPARLGEFLTIGGSASDPLISRSRIW